MTEKQRKAIELLNHCNSWLYLSEEQAINDEEYMLLMDFVVDGTNRDEKKLQHVYVFHDAIANLGIENRPGNLDALV